MKLNLLASTLQNTGNFMTIEQLNALKPKELEKWLMQNEVLQEHFCSSDLSAKKFLETYKEEVIKHLKGEVCDLPDNN